MLTRKVGIVLLSVGLGIGLIGSGFAQAGRNRSWEVLLIGLGTMISGWGVDPWVPSRLRRGATYYVWLVTAGCAVLTVVVATMVAR